MGDRIADPETGHPVGLREGARHDEPRVLDRRRDHRLVTGSGHVVDVGLVHQDAEILLRVECPHQKILALGRVDERGHRVVRVAIEEQSAALAGVERLVEIHLELSRQRNRLGPVAHQVRVTEALLVGRQRPDESLLLACVLVGAVHQDLGRAGAHEDVLRLHSPLLGDGLLQGAREPERIPPRNHALGSDDRVNGVHNRLTGPQRVLVVGEVDRLFRGDPHFGGEGELLAETRADDGCSVEAGGAGGGMTQETAAGEHGLATSS